MPDPDVRRMNIPLVREEGRKTKSERRRYGGRGRNNCSGTVDRGGRNSEDQPLAGVLSLGYPFAYGPPRMGNFPYRGALFKYSSESIASSCYTRDIASLRDTPALSSPSPARRCVFFTRNFRNCSSTRCVSRGSACHTRQSMLIMYTSGLDALHARH